MTVTKQAKAYIDALPEPIRKFEAQRIIIDLISENDNLRAMLVTASDGVDEAIQENVRLRKLLRRALVVIERTGEPTCLDAEIRRVLE